MKRLIGKPLLLLILAGCLWPAVADAQITSRIGFSTTFPFTAGNATFPAGSYTVTPMEDLPEVVEISSTDGKTSALFETVSATLPEANSKCEVVFKKYGGNYVLSEIHEPGAKGNVMAVKSHAERQHGKKSGAPSKETVPAKKTP